MQGVREKAGGLMQLGVSTSYKLRVQRNQAPNNQWFEQDLTETVSQEPNRWYQAVQFSIPVDDAIKKMFDEAPIGGDFDIRIIASYNYSDPKIPDVQKYYPPTPIVFVPNPIIPNLVVTSPINKDTSISGFSLLDYITTDSPGALSFSIAGYGGPNFGGIRLNATINSDGYVNFSGEGYEDIIVNQAASGIYAAASVMILLVVSAPP
jgi:hypothetical protein